MKKITQTRNPDREQKTNRPVLRFNPTAWAKLLYFRDRGPTEIAGFGITPEDDLLFIDEFKTVRQIATGASFSFDDDAVANFFDDQVDAGRKPEQFARIWLHSHPGDDPEPSMVDEETFQRVFGGCDWAVMFVIAQNSKTYCLLRFNLGPGGNILIPSTIDYEWPFPASDQHAWEAEYKANIKVKAECRRRLVVEDEGVFGGVFQYGMCPDEFLQQMEEMEPAERRVVMDELAIRPDMWDDESEGSMRQT